MINNLENVKAISEVNAILKQLNKKDLNKIPSDLLNSIEKKATADVSYIKPQIPLEALYLQEETKAILAAISYKYFCDKDERANLINVLKNN